MWAAVLVVARQHDADALAFQYRERSRAEIENDVMDIGGSTFAGEFQVAGDFRDCRLAPAEQIDTRLARGGGGFHPSARTLVCVIEQCCRFVVDRFRCRDRGAVCIRNFLDLRQVAPGKLLLEREWRLHLHEVVDRAGRAGRYAVHAEIAFRDIDDIVIRVMCHRPDRARRLARVAADAHGGVDQVLLDGRGHVVSILSCPQLSRA